MSTDVIARARAVLDAGRVGGPGRMAAWTRSELLRSTTLVEALLDVLNALHDFRGHHIYECACELCIPADRALEALRVELERLGR